LLIRIYPIDSFTFFRIKKIFNAANLDLVTFYQESIQLITPKPGWVEQDPNEILDKTILCVEKAIEQLQELGFDKSDIQGTKTKV
jgi:glycerol kinase